VPPCLGPQSRALFLCAVGRALDPVRGAQLCFRQPSSPLAVRSMSRPRGERRPASGFCGPPGSPAWWRMLRPCIHEFAGLGAATTAGGGRSGPRRWRYAGTPAVATTDLECGRRGNARAFLGARVRHPQQPAATTREARARLSCRPVSSGSRQLGLGAGQSVRQLLTVVDPELAEHLAQMPLHCAWAQEKASTDVRV
jgi:hypothetical protein